MGRPRKIGHREKNGRIQRAYINPKAQVAAQPHRKVVMLKHREWPEAESEFGRLMLNGHITPAQYEAGKLYAGLAESYRAAIYSPRITPSAMNFDSTGKSVNHGMPDDTARAITRRYDNAFCAIGNVKSKTVIADVVIREKPVSSETMLGLLKVGLNDLIAHFGLDKNLQITVNNAR